MQSEEDAVAFCRDGWTRERFRICVSDNDELKWLPIDDSWVNLSFGICEHQMMTSVGVVRLARATYLPSGTNLLLAEELDDVVLAAEITEPLLPDDDGDDSEWWPGVQDRVLSAWREAGFVLSGITNRFGRPIFHLGSHRLLRAVMRREIEQHKTWGGPSPGRVARAPAAGYPTLVTGMDQPALVKMLEDEMMEWLFDRAVKMIIDKDRAAAGITNEMIEAKIDAVLKQTDGDRERATEHLVRWFQQKKRESNRSSDI
jgi:hypothetical protein